jgi:hypothetical protein
MKQGLEDGPPPVWLRCIGWAMDAVERWELVWGLLVGVGWVVKLLTSWYFLRPD